MAINLKKSKKGKEIPKKEKLILLVSLSLFLLVFVGYVVTINYTEIVKERQDKVLSTFKGKEKEISELKEWEVVFIREYQKISFIEQLIYKRKTSREFFDLLEALTHPNVYFKKLDLDTENNRVYLEGVAQNFMVFGQQVKLMREKGYITEGEVPGLVKIKANVLGKKLDGYAVGFYIEEGLMIRVTYPNEKTKTKKSSGVDFLEEDLEEMLSLPVSVTFFKKVDAEMLDNKNISFASENLISQVEVIKATVEKDSKEEWRELIEEINNKEESSDEEEEEEEYVYFPGEVEFRIMLNLNPKTLGVKND